MRPAYAPRAPKGALVCRLPVYRGRSSTPPMTANCVTPIWTQFSPPDNLFFEKHSMVQRCRAFLLRPLAQAYALLAALQRIRVQAYCRRVCVEANACSGHTSHLFPVVSTTQPTEACGSRVRSEPARERRSLRTCLTRKRNSEGAWLFMPPPP